MDHAPLRHRLPQHGAKFPMRALPMQRFRMPLPSTFAFPCLRDSTTVIPARPTHVILPLASITLPCLLERAALTATCATAPRPATLSEPARQVCLLPLLMTEIPAPLMRARLPQARAPTSLLRMGPCAELAWRALARQCLFATTPSARTSTSQSITAIRVSAISNMLMAMCLQISVMRHSTIAAGWLEPHHLQVHPIRFVHSATGGIHPGNLIRI